MELRRPIYPNAVSDFEDRTFAARLREGVNIAVLCVVAALLLCAATIGLVLYEVWTVLFVRPRDRRLAHAGRAENYEIASASISRSPAAMPQIHPPSSDNDAPVTPMRHVVEWEARRTSGSR